MARLRNDRGPYEILGKTYPTQQDIANQSASDFGVPFTQSCISVNMSKERTAEEAVLAIVANKQDRRARINDRGVETKLCRTCGEELPTSEFYKDQAKRDGYSTQCRPCKHPEIKTRRRKWADTTTDKQCRECEKVLPRSSFYKHKSHKDGLSTECKKCHIPKVTAWAQENRDKTRKNKNASFARHGKRFSRNEREAIRQSPRRKLRQNLASRLNKLVRDGVGGMSIKAARTMELVSCDIDELMQHLEKQFDSGMSWENYGKDGWHVDHIIPCNHFDLTDPDEQRRCFHFMNLQPMWAEENMSKQDRYVGRPGAQ